MIFKFDHIRKARNELRKPSRIFFSLNFYAICKVKNRKHIGYLGTLLRVYIYKKVNQ